MRIPRGFNLLCTLIGGFIGWMVMVHPVTTFFFIFRHPLGILIAIIGFFSFGLFLQAKGVIS